MAELKIGKKQNYLTVTNTDFVLAPEHDSRSDALWQATGDDLQRSSVQRHIDTSSATIQHYVFLTGEMLEGPLELPILAQHVFKPQLVRNIGRTEINVIKFYIKDLLKCLR